MAGVILVIDMPNQYGGILLTETQSLSDFAESVRKPNRKCWACNLPESDEINKGFNKGLKPRVIQRWLVEEQEYPINEATIDRIEHHFRRAHHVEG